jgi:hypothetical protein
MAVLAPFSIFGRMAPRFRRILFKMIPPFTNAFKIFSCFGHWLARVRSKNIESIELSIFYENERIFRKSILALMAASSSFLLSPMKR